MRATERALVGLMTGALLGGVAPRATAQLDLSEKSTLIQVIDGDSIVISGSRPSRRGREIFGKEVRWNREWTPGANNSTTLSVGRDFQINGTPVSAGKYSVWMIPRPDDHWTLVLDRRADLFHTAHPDSTAEQLHFAVTARTIDPVETLTWSINDIRGWRGTVRMQWADKSVEFGLKLNANVVLAVAPELAGRMIGEYRLVSADSTDPVPAEALVVAREGELLTWRFVGGQAALWADGSTWVLVPRGAGNFQWGMAYEGDLVGLIDGLAIEFIAEGGKPAVLEVRQTAGDKLWFSGVRKP